MPADPQPTPEDLQRYARHPLNPWTFPLEHPEWRPPAPPDPADPEVIERMRYEVFKAIVEEGDRLNAHFKVWPLDATVTAGFARVATDTAYAVMAEHTAPPLEASERPSALRAAVLARGLDIGLLDTETLEVITRRVLAGGASIDNLQDDAECLLTHIAALEASERYKALIEAAKRVVIVDSDPSRPPAQAAEISLRAQTFRAAIKAIEEAAQSEAER